MLATLRHDGFLLGDRADGRHIQRSVEDISAITLTSHEARVRCSRCSQELAYEDVHDAHGTCMGRTWVEADDLTCTCSNAGYTEDSHDPVPVPLGWLHEATITANEGEDAAEVTLRTDAGAFTLRLYRDAQDGHLYLTVPNINDTPDQMEHVEGTTYRHTGDPLG